jgi:hypothetical protein
MMLCMDSTEDCRICNTSTRHHRKKKEGLLRPGAGYIRRCFAGVYTWLSTAHPPRHFTSLSDNSFEPRVSLTTTTQNESSRLHLIGACPCGRHRRTCAM